MSHVYIYKYVSWGYEARSAGAIGTAGGDVTPYAPIPQVPTLAPHTPHPTPTPHTPTTNPKTMGDMSASCEFSESSFIEEVLLSGTTSISKPVFLHH
jgi:hypothetical protein